MLLRGFGLAHSPGQQVLFNDLEVSISLGDRVGLVGHNGSGKSTLLKLLAGVEAPDAGQLEYRNGLQSAMVEQFLPDALAHKSMLDAATAAATDGERWRAEAILFQLGFGESEFGIAVGDLSGGQQNRLMFARALVADPELLFLDEPTNHLDLATMVVFETVLTNFPGAFILVSHDRTFLDAVTRSTLFLRDQRLYRFSTSYSRAAVELADMDAAAARARAAEDRKIDALKVSAKRLATWGKVYDSEKMSRRAKNMEKRIDRMEGQRTEVSRGSPLELDVSLGEVRARQVLLIEGLGVQVADRRLFDIAEFLIRPGDRVGLLGHNGVGKSTLIRHIVAAYHNESEDRRCRIGPQTKLGYYDQELDEVAGKETLVEFIRNRLEEARVIDEQSLRGRLIHAGFPFSEHGKQVQNMSGGERARLLFLVLSLNEPNFLILDEPTNHIDIAGKEQLEAQLIGSRAALLVTSHDRRFLETVADRFLWVRDGGLVEVNSPDEFFNDRRPAAGGERRPVAGGSMAPRVSDAGTSSSMVLDDDAALARIVELEDKLNADIARKPRFQKPKLQDQWRLELAQLYERIEPR